MDNQTFWLNLTRNNFQLSYDETCPLCHVHTEQVCIKTDANTAIYRCMNCQDCFEIDRDKNRLMRVIRIGA